MVLPIPQQIPAGYGLYTQTLQSIYGPKQYSFNLGFKTTYLPGDNFAQSIWAALSTAAGPFIPANFTDRYKVVKSHALYQDDTSTLVMEYPINVAGTGSWESPPPNTAVLVQKRTGLAGRNQRGRMYIPPTVVNEANVDTLGIIATTPLGLMQTAWNNAFATLTGVNIKPCLLHGGTKAVPGTAPIPTLLTAFLVESMVATQRRRLR